MKGIKGVYYVIEYVIMYSWVSESFIVVLIRLSMFNLNVSVVCAARDKQHICPTSTILASQLVYKGF
jgi:hypothetical protein